MNARKKILFGLALALTLSGGAYAEFPRGKVSLDLRDADVRDVIWAFAKEHKMNIVIGEDVRGKVTLSVTNVPVRTAFDSLLDNAGLGFRQSGDILKVNALETIKKNQTVEPLVTRIITLNYFTTRFGTANVNAIADTSLIGGGSAGNLAGGGGGGGSSQTAYGDDLQQLKEAMEKHLSGIPGASITIVSRTNSMMITDIASNVDRIVEMAKRLDVASPQVLIEAKIVEIDANYSRDLGITTNFNAARTNNPQVGGGAGSNFTTGSGGGTIGSDGSVASVLGSSAFDFFLKSVGAGDVVNLQIIIDAAEKKGLARTIGTPRVTTLNNKEAIISSGQRIPFTTIGSIAAQGGSNLVATVQFVDAALRLMVTPHVTNDGTVLMKVRASRDSADFTQTVFQNPTINTREASNEVLVRDAETIVIGGIYINDESDAKAGTPFLQDIPVLGNLFKNSERSKETRELIFLITPRVVRDRGIIHPKPELTADALALRSNPLAETPTGN